MEFATYLEGEGMHVNLVELQDREEYVYAIAISPDGRHLATVLGDGSLILMDAKSLHILHRTSSGKTYDGVPSTAVQWLGKVEEGVYDLASISSSGGVFIWRWDGKVLERLVKVHEKDNEITCLAVSGDSEGFLTAGSDRVVRYYGIDGELRGKLYKGYSEDGMSRSTHTNRILSVRFVTSTIAVSGGWGSPIQVWDMRNLESRMQLLGTQLSADGIEPIPDTTCVIVTSRRAERQLQVFDCVSGNEICDDSARISAQMEDNLPLISRFCKKTGLLWVITSKPYKILVISFSSGKLLASCNSPFPLMNVELSDHFPRKAFISCGQGRILVATVNA